MEKIYLLEEILRGSVRYEIISGGILKISSYYDNKEIFIDLNEINEEAIISKEEFYDEE